MAGSLREKVSAWLALSRVPFHSVGVLPFVLGMVLAWRLTGAFRWDVGLVGTLGVVLVMLATYYAGEYWDFQEDSLAAPTRFAGGSGAVPRGLVSRRTPLWASLISVALALGAALILQFGYGTGPWTMPFMLVALLGGFFYSARPVRWVRTGLGELWIAFCYGWLPVAVGCYLQTGDVPPVVHWLAVPIGLTIFNVILLNEFPDYPADREAGKANLTVRLGPERAAVLYSLAAVGSGAAFWLSLTQGAPLLAGLVYLPVLALALVLAALVLRGRWRDRAALERLCGANILVNLGTTAAYLVAFIFR